MMDERPAATTETLELSDGTLILMEVNAGGPYDGPVSMQEMQISAQRALRAVSSLAADLREIVAKAKPDKVKAEFAIELEKKNGDILSKICNASGKGSIKFTLEWDFGKEAPKA